MFILRAYLVNVLGDTPAIAKVNPMLYTWNYIANISFATADEVPRTQRHLSHVDPERRKSMPHQVGKNTTYCMTRKIERSKHPG